ncbi:uncharacterized protein MONOS_1693 [Monocercomonoides exilis]|uniref:uncharacterized protein n=1 Tax=Monocercomonoides exilis TaxID=2049356 RepID=UPI003559BDD6|nr:hypothetical protein MONOS_1693 [Monocercomonoides exilis]|eukprot:MONOS_1693.1-p1 / transcript=MONOS_1693.1 / gene=MONOS_1693 / organism=Monocercomonoides_exilis_PA203 / gene_product=unspecified product / transcript_product=unspecified product / location=Mono_scaffold00031:112763-114087(+) / protein_length=243 / sequence_SO=supercontig / SO=protein_coding / is_pseudo=false
MSRFEGGDRKYEPDAITGPSIGIVCQCFHCGLEGTYQSLGNLQHSCGRKFFACPCPACHKIGSWAKKGALRCTCGHTFYGDICHNCNDVFVCDESLFPGVFVHDKCGAKFTAMVCPSCKEIGHWDVSGRILHCRCGARFFATYCQCSKFASWPAEAVPGILIHSSCSQQFYCDVCACGDLVLWNKDAFPGMLSHKGCGAKFLALACPYCHKIGHWSTFGVLHCLCGKQFKVTPELVSGKKSG